MSKITPFLWFNDDAEQAVKFYHSIFKKSKLEKFRATTKPPKRPLVVPPAR